MNTTQQDLGKANRRLLRNLLIVTVGMFGFGFALVPLYDVFCEITGINGKNTGRVTAEQVAAGGVDTSRLVNVEFVTHVNGDLPWEFRSLERRVQVHPGEVGEVLFRARNFAARSTQGHAVPSLSPGHYSKYLSKTECFCFVQQTLEGHESRDMPVRFMVDPNLPAGVTTLTLSYTFFGSDRAPVRGGRHGAQADSEWLKSARAAIDQGAGWGSFQ